MKDKKMTEKQRLDAESLRMISELQFKQHQLERDLERKKIEDRVNKFIRTSTGILINTDFIVSIKEDYYSGYIIDMVDGVRYTLEKDEETEGVINYLLNLKI